jgi:hypothetical protein
VRVLSDQPVPPAGARPWRGATSTRPLWTHRCVHAHDRPSDPSSCSPPTTPTPPTPPPATSACWPPPAAPSAGSVGCLAGSNRSSSLGFSHARRIRQGRFAPQRQTNRNRRQLHARTCARSTTSLYAARKSALGTITHPLPAAYPMAAGGRPTSAFLNLDCAPRGAGGPHTGCTMSRHRAQESLRQSLEAIRLTMAHLLGRAHW